MTFRYVTEASELPAIANAVASAKLLALDLETTGFDPHSCSIRILSLNDCTNTPWVIDLFKTGGPGPIVEALRGGAIKIGQNLKFEQKFMLKHWGLELKPLFDTYRASALIYNGRLGWKHDLFSLYERELQMKPKVEDLAGSGWGGALTPRQLEYAADDVIHLPQLREVLRQKLVDNGLLGVAKLEFNAILPEASMELNGFHLDQQAWLNLALANAVKEKEYRLALLDALPHPDGQLALLGMQHSLNLQSPKQLLAALHRTGMMVPDTSEGTLAMWSDDHPIVKKILDYREYAQCLKSFGAPYLSNISKYTGRIHTSFFPFTGAGRYASSKPNLQQIPRKKEFRGCFTAAPGRRLVIADYSQIELRIAAELAEDRELMGVYIRGEDAHSQTASLISSTPIDRVTKEQRSAAKAVNFGLIYGMSAKKLPMYAKKGYGVTLSERDAETYHRRYFQAYSGIRRWHREIFDERARGKGVTRTRSGRLRYLDANLYNEFSNCVDAETEALTRRGWVKGFDLVPDEVILTKNINSGVLEWQPMTDLRLFPNYAGRTVEFASRSFSAVSTPEHRWMVTDKASGKNLVKTTDELSRYGDHRIHRTGDYSPSIVSVLTPDEAELLGWFVTDGFIRCPKRLGQGALPRRNGCLYDEPSARAVLIQSMVGNPAKCARIDALVERVNPATIRRVYNNGNQVHWNLGKTLSAKMLALAPTRALTVDALLRLGRPELERLREAMILGDGTPHGSTARFCTGRREQAEAFQILCTMTGNAAAIVERDMSKYRPMSSKLKNIPKMGRIFEVTVLARQTAQVLERQITERVGPCPVWCPVVPNTFFVARRSGRVFITGNTPVQGTGADGLKNSLRFVYERVKSYADMVHCVHDEIVLEVDNTPELVARARRDLEAGMIDGMKPFLRKVPVVVEVGDGPSWAEK